MTQEALELDAQIRELSARRAQLQPGHPAMPPSDPALLHRCENMLWHVRPAGEALELAWYHAGLGWISVVMSRAQIEDLQDCIALAWPQVDGHFNTASMERARA